MADNAGIVVHKTPTRNYALTANSEAGLKSTPLAVGPTAVSEHISSVGVEVNNLKPDRQTFLVRPWNRRDLGLPDFAADALSTNESEPESFFEGIPDDFPSENELANELANLGSQSRELRLM
ncbi:hypothetical protein EDD22DRAFT_948580 [Suillus occidentalis]|nr:hypothetical protein EDD22DRAFT_948580 [Suillus occidentalis]